MNSEFPMSFVSEQPSGKKNNIVPLSRRPRSSQPESHVSSATELPKSNAVNDYPYSEFDGANRAYDESMQTKSPARKALRLGLMAVLLGLWGAIGLGVLTSESELVVKVRDMLSLSDSSAAATAQMSQPDMASVELAQANATESVSAASAEMQATTATESRSSAVTDSLTSKPEDTSAPKVMDSPAAKTVDTSAAKTVDASAVKAGDADVQKAVQLLLQQQKSNLELTGQLITTLLSRSGQAQLTDQQLGELEVLLLEMSKKIKQQRAQLRQ